MTAGDPDDRPVRGGGSAATVHLQGARHRAIETARSRLLATGVMFLLLFLVMGGRLVDLTVFGGSSATRAQARSETSAGMGRGDIVDRNGVILATSLPTASVYADPHDIIDPDLAVAELAKVFPDLDREVVRARLASSARFVWVRRGLTPDQQDTVNRLGIPGLSFMTERRRVYPHGRAAAHVIGFTDIDDRGIAGVEQWFDPMLSKGETLRLSLDIRVQDILRHELQASQREFRARGAAGLVLDVATGEAIGMVSLPDFDPNEPALDPADDARFNRVSKGVYEMGSTMKLFTVAMALDSGTTTLSRGYDATKPLHVARFTITDYHAKKRWLSTPEILVYSSNIGSALMALDVGTPLQREYLQRFGLLQAPSIDLPEVGTPLLPHPWREINTMTVAFGHGIAITPLQLATGVAALVNGGVLRPAALVRHGDGTEVPGKQVLSSTTSRQMRRLMRMVVLHGTGGKADVPGYKVGGKTGTAEKLVNGRYVRDARISSFVGAFPIDAPRYVVLAMLDEPKGNRSTANYATGGWVAAPVVAQVVRRMAPLLGIMPVPDDEVPDDVHRAQAARPRTAAPSGVTAQHQPRAGGAIARPVVNGDSEKHLAAN